MAIVKIQASRSRFRGNEDLSQVRTLTAWERSSHQANAISGRRGSPEPSSCSSHEHMTSDLFALWFIYAVTCQYCLT